MKAEFARQIGIIGGGQLARMLCLEGHALGFEMHVLSHSPQDPAAQVTRHWSQGHPDNPQDLQDFAQRVDLLTLESEFHSAELLADVVKQTKTPLFPPPSAVGILQDRLTQKTALLKAKVPTAEFVAVSTPEEARLAFSKFKKLVFKKRRGGYDGYGTFVVRDTKEFETQLGKMNFGQDHFIAERFIPFRRELALLLSRDQKGEIRFFPLVQTHQVDSRLDWLIGPVRHPKLNPLLSKLKSFAKALNYVGVLAFELFDSPEGLLVNETAPRVHNSGHASLEALNIDQFRAHLLAIAGHRVPEPKTLTKAFALCNLIGQGSSTPRMPTELKSQLHWYGKTESRQGRKMGHLTAVGSSTPVCLKQVLKDRKAFQL